MSSHRIDARPPAGPSTAPALVTDPEHLRPLLEDAAHFSGGWASGLTLAATERDVADALGSGQPILPVGAQSSLTGGATPMGETLLSTARLNRVLAVGSDSVRVQAGVSLSALDEALGAEGRYYPPAPTFDGAFVGGTVATNAAGAATFKYGTTRDWVKGLTVVLPGGDVLDIVRGAVSADPDRGFEVRLAGGVAHVPAPRYVMPDVPKISAGYFSRPGMDLIDLFIGSEGTLGVITEVTLRVLPARPVVALAFATFRDRAAAMRVVHRLRDDSRETWRSRNPRGLDVSAIEHLDARSLALLREDGIDRKHGVRVPADAAMALLVTLELPAGTTAERAFDDIGRARDADAPDTPLVRFCRILDQAGVLDTTEIAAPDDRARAYQLLAVREAVPEAVNARVGRAKRDIDARIEKTAADMIVPFDVVDDLLTAYDEVFGRHRLDVAVWGHISDGNVHPNVIPRSFADVEAGKTAILELGRRVIQMGGSPLAEHGVGRNPVKQQLLQEMYGAGGIEDMRRIKRAFDPQWRLAPGVLFPSRSG